MFSRLRAADSIARGSCRSFSTSVRNIRLPLRNVSTSVRILTNCFEAFFILARVRAVTVTQTANVARIIIPKTTHDGMIPPRRRTSARVPIISSEISRTGAKTGAKEDTARGATRCERIRSSTQYVFMTLLKTHLQVRLLIPILFYLAIVQLSAERSHC